MTAAMAAARVGDPIGHSSGLMGFLVGAAIGIAVGVAIVAATIGTGGLALAAAVGGGVAIAGAAAKAGQAIGGMFSNITGVIKSGASTVFINGKAAARVGDATICSKKGHTKPPIAAGSQVVFIEGRPAAREGDKISCGAKIAKGSPDTFFGAAPVSYMAIQSEVPQWMTDMADGAIKYGTYLALGAGALSVLTAGSLCLMVQQGGAFVVGNFGDKIGGYAGEKIGYALGGEEGAAKGKMAGEGLGFAAGFLTGRRAFSGHPVDVVSGELLCEHTDFGLPGPIPLIWHRSYLSSSTLQSDLGHKWHHRYDMELIQRPGSKEEAVVVRLYDGRFALFHLPEIGKPCFNYTEQLVLHKTQQGYRLQDFNGLNYLFDNAFDDPLESVERRYWLDAIVDERDNRIQFKRNDLGRLIGITDSVGRTLEVVRSNNGQLIKQVRLFNSDKNEFESLVRYQYTEEGDLAAIYDGNNHCAEFDYDNHLVVREQHRGGFNYYFDWDDGALGIQAKCIKTWGGSLENPRYYRELKYDTENRTTDVIDGRQTTMRYIANDIGLVRFTIAPNGEKTETLYNDMGLVEMVCHPNGANDSYVYDDLQRLVQHINPEGNITEYQYHLSRIVPDGHHYNDITSITQADGGVHIYHYSAYGELSQYTDPEGRHRRYLRDSVTGVPVAIGSSENDWDRYHWNEQQQLVAKELSQGGKRTFEYDYRGRLIQTQCEGVTTTYTYDANGNRLSLKRGDQEQFWQYNADDQLIKHTLANGSSTQWTYEDYHVVSRINPDNTEFAYQYDSDFNLTALVNERGETYGLEYDENERLVREVGFDGREQIYEYNELGQLAHWRDNTRQAHYSRDIMNRLVQVDYRYYQNGAQINEAYGPYDPQNETTVETVIFSYDVMGRIAEAHNIYRQLSFAYNLAGDLIGERQDRDIIEHQYDEKTGALAATILPDGRQLNFDYNQHHQLRELKMDGRVLTQYQYDHFGREQRRQCGQLTIDKDYDPAGRLIQQKAYKASLGAGALIQRNYGYNAMGQLISKDDLQRGQQRYQYGVRYQLTGIDHIDREQNTGQSHYEFDPAGHLINLQEYGDAANDSPPLVVVEPDGSTREPAVFKGRLHRQGDKVYSFDESGNRIRQWRGKGHQTETEYRYGVTGDLIEVIDKKAHYTIVARFTYDALGRRVSKTIEEVRVDGGYLRKHYQDRYLWLGNVLLQENRKDYKPRINQPMPEDGYDDGATTYLHEPASYRPLLQIHQQGTKENIYYYQLDQIGTPMELTNEAGHTVWSANYSGFGRAKVANGRQFEARNPIRYQGQYEDEEIGLHYNRFRYYDPLSGQYTQQDPIGLAGGTPLLSQYVNNPMSFVDPLGLQQSCGDVPVIGEGGRVVENIPTTTKLVRYEPRDIPTPMTPHESPYFDMMKGMEYGIKPANHKALFTASSDNLDELHKLRKGQGYFDNDVVLRETTVGDMMKQYPDAKILSDIRFNYSVLGKDSGGYIVVLPGKR